MYLEKNKPGSWSEEEGTPLSGSCSGKVLSDGMCGKPPRRSTEKLTLKLQEMNKWAET